MKIETHPRDDHQITMIVEIEPEKMEGARRRAARRIAEKVKISGFRPGKAPYDVVRRMYGDGVITEEAVEILVDEIYPEAIKDINITPAGAGKLENIESLDPPKFIFTVPLKPVVALGDYNSIRLPYEFITPDDDKLEENITSLRRMYAKSETVERAIQDGDHVLLDVVGHKNIEEETALVERKGFAIVAHSEDQDNEWPFPGFSINLIGIIPGESKKFSHQFAPDFSDESLAGQNVNFEVTVKTVRSINMPEMDDDFAKKTGIGQNVDELRQRMRDNLEIEARNNYEEKYFEKLMDLIKAGATIKYPPQMLEHELEIVLEDMALRLKNQGVENMDAYYKIINSTKEKFIEEQARPISIKYLERGLIMDELVRAENIEIDNDALAVEFENAWATLSMTDEDFAKRTKNGTNASREIVDAVARDSANRLLTRRVHDRLKTIATSGMAETEHETVTEAIPDVVPEAAATEPETVTETIPEVATEAAVSEPEATAEAPSETVASTKKKTTKKKVK